MPQPDPSPVPHHWERTRIPLLVAPPAPSTGITQADLVAATSQAIDTWKRACPECTLPEVVLLPAVRNTSVTQDGKNVILLRTGLWCPPGDQDALNCYDPGRAAITHGYLPPGGELGRLAEADIELNAVHYRWSLGADRPDAVSLQAVVLHEVGHFYGLIHSNHPDALMHPRVVRPGGTLPTAPTKADLDALTLLYPPSNGHGRVVLPWLVAALGIILVGLLLFSNRSAFGRARRRRG